MENIPSGIYVIVGAFIGSLTSIITLTIQRKFEIRKELTKTAFELAKYDHSCQVENAKLQIQSGKPKIVAPVESYFLYYHSIIKTLSAGKLDTDKKMSELKAKHNDFQDKMYNN
jgi:hypothetical protein